MNPLIPPQVRRHALLLGGVALLALVLVLWPVWVQTQKRPAEEVVRSTAGMVMDEVRRRADEFSQNPDRLYLMVEKQVATHFDFVQISRLALGRHWSGATPAQRERFAAAFQAMLIRSYARSLLIYRDDPIQWHPTSAAPDAQDVLVRSSVTHPGSSVTEMNYRVHLRDGEWRVYDITIDGISLVINYRGIFSHEIREKGLDALIEGMERRNAGTP